MGKMTLVLPDELEDRFRKTVFDYKGMRKGNIQACIEEAIELWIIEKARAKSIPEEYSDRAGSRRDAETDCSHSAQGIDDHLGG